MLVELSPASYLALRGLVEDALLQPSDATFILKRVARELQKVAEITAPSELAEQPELVESLRNGTAP